MSYFTAAKIGAALAKARVKAGLSQREMAILIGKNERTVQNWEKGTSDPSTSNLFALAKLYGISVEELLKEVE